MHEQEWDVASDALVVEQLLATTIDPVTNRATAISLHSECPRMRATDAVLTVVTLGYDHRTTQSLPGRARGVDVAERVLSRHLERWADRTGTVVAIGEAAVASIAMTTHDEAQELRARLPELRAQMDQLGGTLPLIGAAQGPSRESSDVVARAIQRLVLPATLPAQDQWSAGEARSLGLWDVMSGTLFGSQLRMQAATLGDEEARRAESMQALTRPERYVDTAAAVLASVPYLVRAADDPVVWDATAVLCGTGPSRAPLAELLAQRTPRGAWIGVAAWLLNVPEVLQAMRSVRAGGHPVVITGYGSGREPLHALDELPVDAVVLDPYLERGARYSSEDRAVLDAILDHAQRNGLPTLTVTRGSLGLDEYPLPVTRPRTPEPEGQLLERARLVGMTLRETAVLVNATHGQGPFAPRWDRYDIASHWARASA